MRIHRIVAAFVLVVSATAVNAATDWLLVHNKTVEAIDLLYNLEFANAEKKCNEVIGLAPKDPRGHFIKSMTYYYRMTFRGGSKNDSAFWAFVYHADKVIKVCEALLEQNPGDTKAMFYMGGTIGFKGLTYANRGEVVKAIWDGKKGYNLLETAVESDPTNMDAKMGLGLFRYMISQAPSEVQSIIKIAGLQGDKWGGLRMLEEAAEKGTYAKQEARRWLYGFCLDEDMIKRSVNHIKWLHEQYPHNWYFLQQYADISCFRVRDAQSAERAYSTLSTLPIRAADQEQVHWSAIMRLGYIQSARGNYREAKEQYLAAYKLTENKQLRQEAALQTGISIEFLGDYNGALSWYNKAPDVKTAQRNASRRRSDEEIMVDKIAWAYSVGLYARVNALADSALSNKMVSDRKMRAQVLYQQGVALLETQQYKPAERCLAQVMEYTEADTWIPPNTQYRLGISLAKQGNVSSARQHYSKALEYEDYPSESILRKRVERELRELSRNSR